MMNFDAAGRYGKQGFNLHGWPQLEPFFREITSAIGPDIPLWQGVSPYSDHWPFFLKGVPTAGMGDPEENKRLGGRGFGHTRYDTVDKVNLRAMRECAANAAIAAVRIANADDWPVTLRPQKEVEAYVQAQGFKETVELGEKLKTYLTKRRKSLKPEARDYLRSPYGWLGRSNLMYQSSGKNILSYLWWQVDYPFISKTCLAPRSRFLMGRCWGQRSSQRPQLVQFFAHCSCLSCAPYFSLTAGSLSFM